MAIANINGVNLYYEDTGIGDPIIFQHGYTASHDGWSGVIERMSASYRCIAMDCRGAGDSAHPEDGYTIEQLAADVVGMADYHGFDRFHYAGQSMGGLIGFELGLSYPDRLLSLSLSAPAPADGIDMPQSARDTMRKRWANQERDLLIRTSLAGVPRESAHGDVPNQVDRMLSVSEGHYDGCWDAMVNFRKGDRLGEIQTPTLILAGAADSLLTPNLKDFARLGNGTLHVFSRVGHGVPREVPSAYARVVTDFLEHGVVNAKTVAAAVAEAASA